MRTLLTVLLICFVQQIIAQTQRDTIAHNVGLAIEKAHHNGDASFISAIFQDSVFCSRFLVDPEGDPDVDFVNVGFMQIDYGQNFANLVYSTTRQSHLYNFIEFYKDESNNYYLVFRLFGDIGITYHEYFLEFIDEQTYFISDFYSYFTDELGSEKFKEIYQLMIEMHKQNVFDQPNEGITLDLDEDFMSQFEDIISQLL